MSKSLGNGIDPLDVVDQMGADAMRFTLINQAAIGTDILLDHEDVAGSFASGRNFANKIWNAGRFALMSLGDGPVRALGDVSPHLELEDRWILSRLQHAAAATTQDLERFRLHEVAEDLYHFFWGEVCDWYLELVKARLSDTGNAESREAARTTLVTVLDGAFRLLHPIMPFITSELWTRIPWPEGTVRPDDLIAAPWPVADDARRDPDAEELMASFQELITEIRRLRKEYGIGEGQRIAIQFTSSNPSFATTVAAQGPALERLARVNQVTSGGAGAQGIGAHAVLSNGSELFLPLEGVIDVERERARLRAEIERLEGVVLSTDKKLANEAFVSRAPAEVVDKEREKVGAAREQAGKLKEKLRALEGMG